MDGPRQTPGTTTRLLVRHVRRRAGDDAVAAVLETAALPYQVADLRDESRWFTYDDKIALFEAAATVLNDPDIGLHVGESLFSGGAPGLRPVLRSLGSPGAVLGALMSASTTYCPVADMDAVEVGQHDGVVRYRLHDEHRPSRHDCGYTIGLLTGVAPVFDLPPAVVDHRACQVLGAEACLYHVRWSPTAKARRLGRRSRRDQVRGLSARFWELERITLDLVDADADGDPSAVLASIAELAADAVGATSHVLVLTDRDETEPAIVQQRFVGGGGAFVDEVLHGRLDDDDPYRIVAELASDRRRYGHVVVTFDDGTEILNEARTILKAYARRAATALDAAAAVRAARLREETASVLLHLARSLAELTTVDDVATRLAELVPTVTGAQQAAVMLYDAEVRGLRVRASVGIPPQLQEEVDELLVPIEEAALDVPADAGERPAVIERAAAQGFIADIMERHSEVQMALVPLRVRGHMRGMISAGWRDREAVGDRSVLEERLQAIADQAATALENAVLLEQVQHQAMHDGLTGLPTQSLFADRVTAEIQRARRNRSRVAVAVLDLDRFKTVNDSLGHGAGDELLVQVAARLARAMRAPDAIARMGGDEFTLLLPDVVDGGESHAAERILEAFVQPFEVEGHRLRISPSIGLAVFPDDGDTCDQLLKCADVAMYRAKDRGRNTWACYASGMAERAYDRLTLETDLYRALQRHELRVAYQPIVTIDGDRVVGAEALVRWAHPTLGLLTPDEFLAIAEDLGLVAEVDGWVLRQACLEMGALIVEGDGCERVAVNLSARTLLHPALERLVADALAAGGLRPDRLVVEISEQVTAEREEALAGALGVLRALGVRVALDDFGRGQSALGRLAQLPIDQLKVAPVFFTDVDDTTTSSPVVEAIVAMAHGLGLEVVAEGIESEAQRAFAQRIGIDLAQGWLLGRPMSSIYEGARSRTA